jgi:hypothetical protein
MPEIEKQVALYKVGDKVRMKYGSRLEGLVSEVRVAYYRGGHNLYRVRVPMTEEVLWLELREDEMEKV